MKYFLQIGEGNFLRAFAEEYIQDAAESGLDYRAVICQPRTNTKVINALKAQNCRYSIIKRGRLNGEVVNLRREITCVENAIDTQSEYEKLKELFKSEDLQIVISNTTEAGIVYNENDKLSDSPAVSFPAKVTALLFERFKNSAAPLVFMPCELIEDNGDALKRCILKYAELWQLGAEFSDYVNSCSFCNTLVDRIVSGHDKLDSDPCSTVCEPYKSWVIQADEYAKRIIPFSGIEFTDSIDFYRKRKVRILNGIHTMSVPAGYMAKIDIVRDLVNDELFKEFISTGTKEIESTLEFPCSDFTESVLERFNNPYIDHRLYDIALNSVSKFRERCLPSLLDYYENNNDLPKALTFSLSALIAFYMKKSEREYELRDSSEVIEFFESNPEIKSILSKKSLWDKDLTEIKGLEKAVEYYYTLISENGIRDAVREVINEKAS